MLGFSRHILASMLLQYSSSSLPTPVREAFDLHIIFNLNLTVMVTTFEKHYIGIQESKAEEEPASEPEDDLPF